MIQFGQKIIATHKLERGYKWVNEKKRGYKFWRLKNIEPCEVMVIGKRTLSDGYSWWMEESMVYSPEKYFPAYLVVENMNENPFYVVI